MTSQLNNHCSTDGCVSPLDEDVKENEVSQSDSLIARGFTHGEKSQVCRA